MKTNSGCCTKGEKPALANRIRRAAGGLLFEGFFEGISRAAKLHPNARLHKHDVERIRDIPYQDTGSAAHTLDVYRPTKAHRRHSPSLPVVLYLHGGAFQICSKETHWVMALAYARRGFVVFNVNYRLAPEHRYPAALNDAAAAYQWVVDNAAAYGGDNTRIVLAGESAGANLSLSLSIASAYERKEEWARSVWQAKVQPKLLVPACGILQVTEPERFQSVPKLNPVIYDRILNCTNAYVPHDDRVKDLEFLDPLLILEGAEPPSRPLPPTFIPVGTKDPIMDDSRRLHRALERLQTPSELAIYPGGIHAFHAFVWQKRAKECWRDTYRFLDTYLPDDTKR
jgi:acetyl esterase